MPKSSEFYTDSAGIILTTIRYCDGPSDLPWHDGQWFIGTPNRMFEFNPLSETQLRRVCVLYGVNLEVLHEFIENASQYPNEYQFMTL